MPRKCSVCAHKNRSAIDEALVKGEPFRNISKRYGVGNTALFRHSKSHLPALMTKAAEAVAVANADGLLAQVQGLAQEAQRIGQEAEKGGDLRCALAAVRELTRIVELLARITGQFEPEADAPKGPVAIRIVAHHMTRDGKCPDCERERGEHPPAPIRERPTCAIDAGTEEEKWPRSTGPKSVSVVVVGQAKPLVNGQRDRS